MCGVVANHIAKVRLDTHTHNAHHTHTHTHNTHTHTHTHTHSEKGVPLTNVLASHGPAGVSAAQRLPNTHMYACMHIISLSLPATFSCACSRVRAYSRSCSCSPSLPSFLLMYFSFSFSLFSLPPVSPSHLCGCAKEAKRLQMRHRRASLMALPLTPPTAMSARGCRDRHSWHSTRCQSRASCAISTHLCEKREGTRARDVRPHARSSAHSHGPPEIPNDEICTCTSICMYIYVCMYEANSHPHPTQRCPNSQAVPGRRRIGAWMEPRLRICARHGTRRADAPFASAERCQSASRLSSPRPRTREKSMATTHRQPRHQRRREHARTAW